MSEPENGDRALRGRAAPVTGASSELGRATAVALAGAGADGALVARSAEELESAEKETSETGGRALVLPVDLAEEDETTRAVEQTVETFGRVDVLVNAAGTDAPGPIEELDVEGWDRTLSVNLRAPLLLSEAAFPCVREAGGGTIVNASSVAGKKGWANASAYCASKFGLAGLTEAFADEGKEHGIRVIVLHPGAMDTNWGPSPRGAPAKQVERSPGDAGPRAGAGRGLHRLVRRLPTRTPTDRRNRASHRGRFALTRQRRSGVRRRLRPRDPDGLWPHS